MHPRRPACVNLNQCTNMSDLQIAMASIGNWQIGQYERPHLAQADGVALLGTTPLSPRKCHALCLAIITTDAPRSYEQWCMQACQQALQPFKFLMKAKTAAESQVCLVVRITLMKPRCLVLLHICTMLCHNWTSERVSPALSS